jgi:hypothetical protein
MKMLLEHEHTALLQQLEQACRERDELRAIVNNPITDQFISGTRNEIAHQVQRWGTVSDRGKEPQDWFWLVGYLAGKALHHHKNTQVQREEVERQKAAGIECSALEAALAYNIEKAKHHTISAAAALGNWWAHISIGGTVMAPGVSDVKRSLIAAFGDELVQP